MKEIVGWVGALFVLMAYFFLVIGYVTVESWEYNFVNLMGGCCLAWRVYEDRNYSNFWLEVIFIIVAITGIIKSI